MENLTTVDSLSAMVLGAVIGGVIGTTIANAIIHIFWEWFKP